jgi:hypothetical protein
MSSKLTIQVPAEVAKQLLAKLGDPAKLEELNQQLAAEGLPQIMAVERGLTGSVVTALEPGDRIRLVAPMQDDPDPLPVGATGKIESVHVIDDWTQYRVTWDAPHDKRSLMPIVPPDVLEKIA